jgi:hypothetical protein
MAQGGKASGGEVVGMDVVGEHVVSLDQGRQAFLQPIDRQTVGCVDSRRAQDGNGHPVPTTPGAQAALGIDPAAGAGAFRIQATGFVDLCAAAVAVNPCRAYVNEPPW